jgi:RNA polymerase sigma factor (sigma-70 family)
MSPTLNSPSSRPAPRESGPTDGALAEFEVLYRTNVAAVTGYFARRTAEPQTVADLTADTFVQAIMSFSTFDPSRGTPRAWVLGIARRIYAGHCQAHSQRRSKVERLAGRRELPPDEVGELIDRIDAERAGRALVTGLTTLSARDRAVIELVDLAGLQAKEAAQVLGIAPGTLRMRLMRARARLHKAASPALARGTDPASEPGVTA